MNTAALIKKIQDLPSIADVAHQINIETKKESLTSKSLGDIISRDPALTSKTLKLANSAYYGLAKQVDTMERAVTVLGLDTVKSLALSVSVFKLFKAERGGFFDVNGLWRHSLGCAVAAKTVISKASPQLAEQAFVCGIIHDIGKIAIAKILPDGMSYIIALLEDTHSPQNEVEKEVLGFTHQKVGALLADQWHFPDDYIQAIKYHHGPFPQSIEDDQDTANLAKSVFVGNKIAKILSLGKSTDPGTDKIPTSFFNTLKITKEDLPKLMDQIKAGYDKITESWEVE